MRCAILVLMLAMTAAALTAQPTPDLPTVPSVDRSGVEWISRFEASHPDAAFGAGWGLSTDQSSAGRSTASFRVVNGGALGSVGALRVEGNVDPGLPYAWAGVAFYPGHERYGPADISTKDSLTFWSRGDGGRYRIMLLADAPDGREARAERRFTTASDWQLISVALRDFRGIDLSRLKGIAFIAGPRPGGFAFELDEIRLR